MYTISVCDFGSDTFRKMVELRSLVLREPLGMVFHEEDIAQECDQHHIAAADEQGRVRATLILADAGENKIKMRQVAVHPEDAGKGLGSAIVLYSEGYARKLNGRVMVLHARKTAVPFYLKLGYQVEGDEFEEVGIPHLRMFKNL